MARKGKPKKWYYIIAPKVFGEREIGVVPASEDKLLLGRRLTISAIDLTNDFDKYYLKLSFKIIGVNGDKALTRFDGSECTRDYISRMVLHKVTRVDNIQDLVTKDGVKIRVKSLTVLSGRTSSLIKKTVRAKVGEMMRDFVTNMTLDDFIRGMLSGKIKKTIFQTVRKIHPVRYFEIRKTEVLTPKV